LILRWLRVIGLGLGLGALVIIAGGWWHHHFVIPRIATRQHQYTAWHPEEPAALARWPWPQADIDHPHDGVTHWINGSALDGTVAELFDFDLGTNPRLRLELYDQDEDDGTPFDNHADFWTCGVAQVTHKLNQTGRGKVVAAWNGLFFNPNRSAGSHVAPVVLDGKSHYNVGVVRWAVGVKYARNRPAFKVIRLPEYGTLQSEFDYAAEGASCLIYKGSPLRLRPFPKPGEHPFPPSKPPAAGEAGYVRGVDHIRTSRTSMAWSRDNRHLYLLIVKEPDAEHPSVRTFREHGLDTGGWTVADLQRFWQAFGVWCAVNLDGGDATQLTALRPDGGYDLVPSRVASDQKRLTCSSSLEGAPAGESMMFFYIKD
jgi:hypothetical protein